MYRETSKDTTTMTMDLTGTREQWLSACLKLLKEEKELTRPSEARLLRDGANDRAGERAFWGVLALAFAASSTVTIVWSSSMSAMGGMAMPGGWTMSMAWMRMPGQTWLGAAASFLRMWVVMMVAMMLPSLVPMLLRYRQAIGRTGETRLGRLTALVGTGYF